MNSIKPNTVSDSFNIPIYQRLFTWGENQIETLLNDLLFEAINSHCSNDYYIGVLTTTRNESLNRYDLVDGQQRFTVMTLFALILRGFNYFKEWERFLTTDNCVRLDFCARIEDRQYLNELISKATNGGLAQYLESESGYVNDTMHQGLCFIRDYFGKQDQDWESLCRSVCPQSNFIIRKEDFAKYIYEHLAFFTQLLPQDYTPRLLNKHFESMNSTGRNLENHEILKVKLLKDVDEEMYDGLVSIWNIASRINEQTFPSYDEKTTAEFREIIKKLRDDSYDIISISQARIISEQRPTVGSSSILSLLQERRSGEQNKNTGNEHSYRSFLTFSDFLLQVLYIIITIEQKESIGLSFQEFFNPDKLVKTCEKFIGKNKKIKPEQFIKSVYKYRVIFDFYIIRIDGNGAYRLAAESTNSERLEQYEAMLYDGTSRFTYYQWIPQIIANVLNHTSDITYNSVLEELKKADSSYNEHQIVKFPINPQYRGFSNYFFRRLDYYLWENIKNGNKEYIYSLFPDDNHPSEQQINELIEAVKKYRFHQYNSVEHFHPQNEEEQLEKWIEKTDINRFGNLALISDSFNSTQKHNPLALKFARVKDQIEKKEIQSIKLAIMYYTAKADSKNWTPTLAMKHEQKMIDFLKATYSDI